MGSGGRASTASLSRLPLSRPTQRAGPPNCEITARSKLAAAHAAVPPSSQTPLVWLLSCHIWTLRCSVAAVLRLSFRFLHGGRRCGLFNFLGGARETGLAPSGPLPP
jgi:hypothetical protein